MSSGIPVRPLSDHENENASLSQAFSASEDAGDAK